MKNVDKHYAAVHVGNPAKSFSASEGSEAERRGWDEDTYRLKNQDMNNHYDITRKHLNFEINGEGEIIPLGSNPTPLHERLNRRLEQLGFKPYKDKNNPSAVADNSPNCTIGIIISGDHDVLTRLAYGDQNIDFSLKTSNANIRLRQGIRDWALDTYAWACERWGAENIVGFDVHCDETTPHIHIQTIPVAMTKTRGRASATSEREKKECVSFAGVWGKNKYEFNAAKEQIHTDYHDKVGYKYGLERGEHLSTLSPEERRNRVHKNKAMLEAERQAKKALAQSKAEKKAVEEEKARMEDDMKATRQRKGKVEKELEQFETYANATRIEEKDLMAPKLDTNPIVTKAAMDMQAELDKPIPSFGRKEWQAERKEAAKRIFTDMQTALLQAKAAQKEEILKLGKSLYQQAKKDIAATIEQNKSLKTENEQLKQRIARLDENAVAREKSRADAAERRANEQIVRANHEEQRANEAESRLSKIEQFLRQAGISEAFENWSHLSVFVEEAAKALADWAHSTLNIFTPKDEQIIGRGIIAKCQQDGLDPSCETDRQKAASSIAYMADSFVGDIGKFAWEVAVCRIGQLASEITIPSQSQSLGGSNGCADELTNWDGSKKRGLGR